MKLSTNLLLLIFVPGLSFAQNVPQATRTSTGTLTRVLRVKPPAPPLKPAAKESDAAYGSTRTTNVIDEDKRLLIMFEAAAKKRTAAQAAADAAIQAQVDRESAAIALFGACTATHLGRGVFLTAGHCIDNHLGIEGFRSSPCPHALQIRGLTESLACKVVTFRYDKTTDYALLELVDPKQADDLPAISVDYGMDWRKWGTRTVRLYGYSGQKLRVNLTCTAKIEAARDRILHDCDTEGGDSGSALIDVITNDIIAVHAGGLRASVNYAYPIGHVPWPQSLCVAVSARERQELKNNGEPAVLRISTSHLSTPFQRMLIQLNGTFAKNRVRVRLLAPEADMEVDPTWITWSGAVFKVQELFVLDQHRAGPWAVEVTGFGTAKQTTKGYVDGRVWVCP